MPLYVRDERVKDLADQVAALRHSTVTDAVREALELRLKQLTDDRAERLRRIDEIIRRVKADPELDPGFTDKDLYDEFGDPIL